MHDDSSISAFDLVALAPDGMLGWPSEAEGGRALVLGEPGQVQVKIVMSERGLLVFASGDDADQARELLLRLGFRPEHIRRMLCG
jgi:hypothetical protein